MRAYPQCGKLDQAFAAVRTEFCVSKVDSDERRWLVKLPGPPDTPYESGVYGVLLEFPKNYPWTPPSVSFQTPIWHPNVCPSTGAVEMQALFPEWLFNVSVLDLLRRLVDMLRTPLVDDAPDAVPVDSVGPTLDTVRFQFCHENPLFRKVAIRWTRKSLELEPLLPQLCQLSRFSSGLARSAEEPDRPYTPLGRRGRRSERRFLSVYQPAALY